MSSEAATTPPDLPSESAGGGGGDGGPSRADEDADARLASYKGSVSRSGCVFPSLFEEAAEMTLASIGAHAAADMRRLARRGKLVGDYGCLFDLPASYADVADVMRRNAAAYRWGARSGDFLELSQMYEPSKDFLYEGRLHYVGDENASSECVHVVSTNDFRKRILLSFRGSITLNDWVQDAKCVVVPNPNPVRELSPEDQPETVGLHCGFRDYLYGTSPPALPLSLPKKAPAVKIPAIPTIPTPSLPDVSLPTPSLPDISLPVSLPGSTMFTAFDGDKKEGEEEEEKEKDKEEEEDRPSTSSPQHPLEDPPASARHDPKEEEGGEGELLTEHTTTSAEEEEEEGQRRHNRPKIRTILDELLTVQAEHPDYKLYITGHSLGAALALCTAVEVAATFGSTHRPVTCVAVANPRAGNADFRRAIECLERRGLLRCLCLHNPQDIVPKLPVHNKVTGDKSFSHVGMVMRLLSRTFEIGRAEKILGGGSGSGSGLGLDLGGSGADSEEGSGSEPPDLRARIGEGGEGVEGQIILKKHPPPRSGTDENAGEEGGVAEEPPSPGGAGGLKVPNLRGALGGGLGLGGGGEGGGQNKMQTPELFAGRANKHSYREYYTRLLAQEEELKKLYLDDLYVEEGFFSMMERTQGMDGDGASPAR